MGDVLKEEKRVRVFRPAEIQHLRRFCGKGGGVEGSGSRRCLRRGGGRGWLVGMGWGWQMQEWKAAFWVVLEGFVHGEDAEEQAVI